MGPDLPLGICGSGPEATLPGLSLLHSIRLHHGQRDESEDEALAIVSRQIEHTNAVGNTEASGEDLSHVSKGNWTETTHVVVSIKG